MANSDSDVMERLLQEVFSTSEGAKRVLEHLLNQAMQVEAAEHVGAARHERSEDRRGYRNGWKPRTLKTRVGELELAVPQVRACEPYHPSMFAKWQRSERALLVACAEMYFQGVSTRNVGEVLFPNRSSCDRLLGAQLLEVHETWSVEERTYFNMKNVTDSAGVEPTRAVA